MLNIDDFYWTREPAGYSISSDSVQVITKPYTDLWQRTYYHFRNDNAPVFQMETTECKWPAHNGQKPDEE